jgi:hypothetical protein
VVFDVVFDVVIRPLRRCTASAKAAEGLPAAAVGFVTTSRPLADVTACLVEVGLFNGRPPFMKVVYLRRGQR